MDIVERISLLCEKHGTNKNALEKNLGLGHGSIQKWSVHAPKIDSISKVASFFDVSIDYLVNGKDYAPSSSPISWAMEHDQEFMEHIQMLFNLSDKNAIYSHIRFLTSEEEKKGKNAQKEA